MLKKECDIRDGLAYLKFEGSCGVNIGTVRSVDKSIKYICKDGEPVESGKRPLGKVNSKSKKEIC